MTADPEFYPMPAFPTLSVRDVLGSSQWYRDKLGFQLVFEIPGQSGSPMLAHLRWARFADLLLLPENHAPSGEKGVGVTLNFAMGERSIDEFAAAVSARGVTNDGPVNQPWNARELTIHDPDGYRLTFTQPIRMDLSIDEVTSNVQNQ